MGKYSHGRNLIFDCCSMSTYIDTIGQSANDKHIGALRGEISHKRLAKVAAIVGTLACAYNAHNTTRIERGIATIEEENWRVIAFSQTRGDE